MQATNSFHYNIALSRVRTKFITQKQWLPFILNPDDEKGGEEQEPSLAMYDVQDKRKLILRTDIELISIIAMV